MAGLAARFASELNVDEDDVLHQLEDLRSAATSGFVSTSATSSTQHHQRTRRMSEETSSQHHNYANFPGSSNLEDKNYMPGIYAVSFFSIWREVIKHAIDAIHASNAIYAILK